MSDFANTETINRILELGPAKTLDVHGFTYIDKDKTATLFTPPAPSWLRVSTLTGFIDLLEAGIEKFDAQQVLVQIDSEALVTLFDRTSDTYGRRQVYAKAALLKPEREFKFNEYHTQENFVIALRSLFIQDTNLDNLVSIAGNLAHQLELKQTDDGFTQQVNVKQGVVFVEQRVVLPRVELRPFRTFREAIQPSSEYVFRVKHDERLGNTCALFEADGGAWRLEAIQNVKEWVSNQLKGCAVDGLSDIPVIA